jgi:hypothetical protein
VIYAANSITATTIPTQQAAQLQLNGLVPQNTASLQAYLAGVAAGTAARTGNAPQTYAPPSTIALTLARVTPKSTAGVSVSGTFNFPGVRTVYLSGIPGNTYSNGTFDVFGVPPGRHVLATRENPYNSKALGASVMVGDRNVTGIDLDEVPVIPKGSWDPTAPQPARNHPEGAVTLAKLHGTAIEEESKKPIIEGNAVIRGFNNYGGSFPIDSEGHFEIPNLLPGKYDVELQVFGHSNDKRSIEVDDEDLKVDVTSRKLY